MRRFILVLLALLAVAAAVLVFVPLGSTTLPAPLPYVGPLPPASPPEEMAIFRLPTAVVHRSTGFAYRGGSLFEERDFAMTAVLVRHPKGDLLIDTGFGRNIAEKIAMLPLPFRLATDYERFASVGEQLDAAGYDRARLAGVLLTHAHWDHVAGLEELPGTPVLIPAEERAFIDEGGTIMQITRSLRGVKYVPYAFDDRPYFGFPKSRDFHGDGAIVIVPVPGHTPGSVIVFLALPGGARYAMVGDLVWQREGILERRERPWLMRRIADHDEAQVRTNILHMTSIAMVFPQLTIVPAHDVRAFETMPALVRP